MSRVAFVMEQHVGHRTYYLNLRRAVDEDSRIAAVWTLVTYTGANRLLDRLPGLPGHLRGTLSGALQARAALNAAFDIAFFNTQVPAALVAGGLGGRPYVIATDITPIQYDAMSSRYGHRPDRPGLIAGVKHRRNVSLLRGAARVLPWSSWVQASLVNDYGVDPARIDVVPPGVDLAAWTPGEGGAAGPLRLLFVGGDFQRKGGATLLKAFRSLRPGLAELHIVTRTRLEPEDGVHVYYDIQPNSPELIALYRGCDVFVLPSEAEAFGIAAVEACAAGLPLVVTAVGGLRDIVVDGENGFTMPVGDEAALVHRLTILAGDPALRRRMAHAARARAEQHFDAQRTGARVISHLLDVARKPVVACSSPVSDRT